VDSMWNREYHLPEAAPSQLGEAGGAQEKKLRRTALAAWKNLNGIGVTKRIGQNRPALLERTATKWSFMMKTGTMQDMAIMSGGIRETLGASTSLGIYKKTWVA